MLCQRDLTFIVDLNELEEDTLLPVSTEFTVEYGPGVWVNCPLPEVGEWVRLYSDEDELMCFGRLERIVSERDFFVRVDWSTSLPHVDDTWRVDSEPSFETTGPGVAIRPATPGDDFMVSFGA